MTGRLAIAGLLGWLAGMIMGPLSFLIVLASDMIRHFGEWPDLTTAQLRDISIWSIPAAVNGAIGAIYTAKHGTLERQPVTIMPIIMQLAALPCLNITRSPTNNQFIALAFTIIIWSAGRVGQRLGLLTRSIFDDTADDGDDTTPAESPDAVTVD